MTPFSSVSESFFDDLLELGSFLFIKPVTAAGWDQFELGAFGQIGRLIENNTTIADSSTKRLHDHHHSTTPRPEPPYHRAQGARAAGFRGRPRRA